MQHFTLIKPTQLAHLVELNERYEELTQQLSALQGQGGTASPTGVLDAREVQVELRQLRQEALKVLSSLVQSIEEIS